MKLVSIIIPTYNEANGIEKTVSAIKHAFASADDNDAYEIIVVDDGSTDGSGDVARALNVNVVRHPQNKGYGQALKTGIAAASYDLIAITDADCTYPVEYIPQLIGDIDKGFDMAVGRRTGPQYWESAFKSPLRYILKYLVEFTAGAKILDINSGLRVFKKSTVTPFLPHLCNTFSFTTSLTLAYMMSGKFVSYIDIPYEKRVGKSKVRLFKDSLTTLQYIVQAIVFYNPIKLFLVFSLSLWAFTALTATILLTVDAYVSAIFGGIGLFSGFMVFSFGLILEFLRQSGMRE